MTVNKDDVCARFENPGAGRAAEGEFFSQVPGPGAGCLTSKQILRAMVAGISGSERGHVLGCQFCLERLRHMEKVSFGSGSSFVQRMLARLEPEKWAELGQATVNHAAFHAIFATASRLQKLDPVLPPSQVFKVELVPLFVLEPFRFDKGSFELRGALQASTIDRIEKVDIKLDGQCDFLRIAFSNLRLSKEIAAAISARRSIYDTVSLVGKVHDAHKKKFDIVAQASLEFKGK